MKKGDSVVWARPGTVPLEGAVSKTSKSGDWVDVEWESGHILPRVALPDPYLFVVPREEN